MNVPDWFLDDRRRTLARSRAALLTGTALFVVLAFGCGPDVEEVPVDECASGQRWIGGNSEDSRMNPGEDCIGCHARDDGPTFAAAGTVYGAALQDNDCFGRQGVTVTVIGANGQEVTRTSNSAGNFWFDPGDFANIELPYTARVTDGTRTVEMVTPQTDTACNSCHTRDGAGGAPGRIVLME